MCLVSTMGTDQAAAGQLSPAWINRCQVRVGELARGSLAGQVDVGATLIEEPLLDEAVDDVSNGLHQPLRCPLEAKEFAHGARQSLALVAELVLDDMEDGEGDLAR